MKMILIKSILKSGWRGKPTSVLSTTRNSAWVLWMENLLKKSLGQAPIGWNEVQKPAESVWIQSTASPRDQPSSSLSMAPPWNPKHPPGYRWLPQDILFRSKVLNYSREARSKSVCGCGRMDLASWFIGQILPRRPLWWPASKPLVPIMSTVPARLIWKVKKT